METITVKQALEQGYTNYVYDEDGFQRLKDIADDVKDGSIKFDRADISVVNIEPVHPSSMTAEQIGEALAEIMEEWYVEETGDDTEQVYDAIKSIDFSDVEKLIDEKLSAISYYRSSGIRLIP